MNKLSLDALVREQMARASMTSGGRSADTVYGGHERALRQTVIALTAGSAQTEASSDVVYDDLHDRRGVVR